MKAKQPQTPAIHSPIDASIRQRIEVEFPLPSLAQVRHRYETQTADPEPGLRKLERVFIGGGTYCPHNYFAAWMVTPSMDLAGSRPVDLLHEVPRPSAALEVFANQ